MMNVIDFVPQEVSSVICQRTYLAFTAYLLISVSIDFLSLQNITFIII